MTEGYQPKPGGIPNEQLKPPHGFKTAVERGKAELWHYLAVESAAEPAVDSAAEPAVESPQHRDPRFCDSDAERVRKTTPLGG
jgi:hypothetical protein